jgi:predicted nucleic acid-binding protein
MFGVERCDPAYRANTVLRVEQLRQQFASLRFDDAAAERYGRIRADLTGRGQLSKSAPTRRRPPYVPSFAYHFPRPHVAGRNPCDRFA